MPWLYHFEVPGIQEYLFSTNHLREISGASSAIEMSLKEELESAVKKIGGEIAFIGGGNGLIWFKEKTDAEKLDEKLYELHGKKSPGLRPKSLYRPCDNRPLHEQIAALKQALEAQPPLPDPQPPLEPMFRQCDSCRLHPAFFEAKKGDSILYICEICKAKTENRVKPDEYLKGFLKYLKKQSGKMSPQSEQLALKPAEHLEEFGEASRTRPGFMALIYADGNNLGQALRSLDSSQIWDKRAIGKFRVFSETLAKAMEQALYKSFSEVLKLGKESLPSTETPDKEALFPFQVLYLGGDDLVMVCLPEHAFSLCEALDKHFMAEMRSYKIDLSFGVVFAGATLPIATLIRLAKQVLASAKRRSFWLKQRGAGKCNECGAIDFEVVTASMGGELEAARQARMTSGGRAWAEKRKSSDKDAKNHRLSARPFSFPELKASLTCLDQLKTKGVSLGRLQQLAQAGRHSPLALRTAFYELFSRSAQSGSKRQERGHEQVDEDSTEPSKEQKLSRVQEALKAAFMQTKAGNGSSWLQSKKGMEPFAEALPESGREDPFCLLLDFLDLWPFLTQPKEEKS